MADVFLTLLRGPAGSGFVKLAVVKRLRPNLVEDPEFVTMLMDEARISARLNHPNVVQTIEVGAVGREYFLAMEYLDGQPLYRVQKRAARLDQPVERTLEYVVILDALAGLQHAHDLADYDGRPLGIVHRDLNPQNILITYDGQVKVVDFGIAKAAGRACETRQGIVKGKVRYMSPEQAMGQSLDHRSDLFAMGILLWEAATGRRFWRERDDLSIVEALVSGDFDPSPRAVDPTVPDAIDAICRRALAAHPEDRFPSASVFREALDDAIGEDLTSARRRLGAKVAELFAKERKQLRSIIEESSRDSLAVSRQPSSAPRATDPSARSAVADSLAPVAGPREAQLLSSRPPPANDVHPVKPGALPDHSGPDEQSLLGFIPRKRRFGAGLLFGAATMLCSFLVAILTLSAVTTSVQSTAPSRRFAREPTTWSRSATFLSAAKRAERPPPHEELASPPALWSPPPPPVPSRLRGGEEPGGFVPPRGRFFVPPNTPRSRTRTLDTTDPWGR